VYLVVKVVLVIVNAGVDGSPSSYAEVLAAPLGGMKSSCVEALASDLGRWLPKGGGACLTEVDQVIFFGLGLKIKASRDIRRRLVRAFSQLGLKPKLLLGRRKLKRKACGFLLRPRPLEVDSRVKLKAGDDRAAEPNLGQGETSSEKVPVVSAIEPSSLSGDDRAAEPDLGQGETSLEKAPVVSAIELSGKSSPIEEFAPARVS
jgi:hypothetical protein